MTTRWNRIGRLSWAAGTCAIVLLASGCTDTPDAPEVAQLPSSSATEGAPDTDGATPGSPTETTGTGSPERPVLRVDDTEERRKSLWNAYNTCLLDHGAQEPPPDGMYVGLGDVAVVYPGPKQAQEACLELEPVQPPALDAATNPDFQSQAQDYVDCLQDRGLWVERLDSESLDWTYAEDHPVPDDSAETEQQCLVQVFGDS